MKQLNENVITKINVLKGTKQLMPVKKQIALMKLGKYTKSDIGALTKLVAGMRFNDNDRKEQIQSFVELYFNNVHDKYVRGDFQCEYMFFKSGPMKITKEQTLLGKAWLKNHFFKLDGTKRSGKNTEYVSDKVLSIVKNVSRFEFMGINLVKNAHGYCNQVLPIYRTYAKDGSYFDYCPIYWGQPIIVEGL